MVEVGLAGSAQLLFEAGDEKLFGKTAGGGCEARGGESRVPKWVGHLE